MKSGMTVSALICWWALASAPAYAGSCRDLLISIDTRPAILKLIATDAFERASKNEHHALRSAVRDAVWGGSSLSLIFKNFEISGGARLMNDGSLEISVASLGISDGGLAVAPGARPRGLNTRFALIVGNILLGAREVLREHDDILKVRFVGQSVLNEGLVQLFGSMGFQSTPGTGKKGLGKHSDWSLEVSREHLLR